MFTIIPPISGSFIWLRVVCQQETRHVILRPRIQGLFRKFLIRKEESDERPRVESEKERKRELSLWTAGSVVRERVISLTSVFQGTDTKTVNLGASIVIDKHMKMCITQVDLKRPLPFQFFSFCDSPMFCFHTLPDQSDGRVPEEENGRSKCSQGCLQSLTIDFGRRMRNTLNILFKC